MNEGEQPVTKFVRKNIYWILGTAVLAAILLLTAARTGRAPAENGAREPILSFRVEGPDGAERILPYVEENGDHTVFLPSYARPEQVTAVVAEGSTAALDGEPLENGKTYPALQTETDYRLELNGTPAGTLRFYRSANVGTLHIETLSGTMELVHGDKEHEETAEVTLYTADGTRDYESAMCSIRGRGNATWGYAKKPYNLTLSGAADLLGMGAGEEWILLANATDETNLHNKLVFELAERAGMEWVPESAFVDVYLNGEYNGLYLLTERIESGSSRLDIDPARGDLLGKVDLNSRWDDLRNPVVTAAGRTVELSEPRAMTEEERSAAKALVDQMEAELLSGGDLTESECLDLDSWVRRYLVDEIAANIDSDLASSYFYYKDGRFFAGPVWDYDRTFGNSLRNQEPTAFHGKNEYKSDGFVSPYYSALYENESFYRRMTELYRTDFLPVLEEWIHGGIEAHAAQISAATEMNDLRWKSMFDLLKSWSSTIIQSTEDLVDYVAARTAFLSDAWLAGTEYCTVQFERTGGETYWNCSVKKGEVLKTPYIEKEPVWLDAETGAVFDFDRPVTEDKILTVPEAWERETQEGTSAPAEVQPDAPENTPEAETRAPRTTGETVTLLSVGLLIVLLLCFGAVDAGRRRKERRGSRARTGTHIPS